MFSITSSLTGGQEKLFFSSVSSWLLWSVVVQQESNKFQQWTSTWQATGLRLGHLKEDEQTRHQMASGY